MPRFVKVQRRGSWSFVKGEIQHALSVALKRQVAARNNADFCDCHFQSDPVVSLQVSNFLQPFVNTIISTVRGGKKAQQEGEKKQTIASLQLLWLLFEAA